MEGLPSFCWAFLLGGREGSRVGISEAFPGCPRLPVPGTQWPIAHCRQHDGYGVGQGAGGRAEEARMKGAHAQRHTILPSARFLENLGALASLLLLGLLLG